MKIKVYYLFVLLCLGSCSEKSAPEYLSDGIEDFNNQDYTSAINEFTHCIEKDFKNVNAYYYKALCETKLTKNKEALISFQKVIELDSSFYQGLIERAKLKIVLGDYYGAIKDCDRAKLIKIDFSEIYKVKADAYEFLGEDLNAMIGFEYAIKYGDKTGETYYKLGKLYLKFGKTIEACENLSKAGELGFIDAYNLIKNNCNKTPQANNVDTFKISQNVGFKSYPGRYSITFPNDWTVNENTNSSFDLLTVTAFKDAHYMTVLEIDQDALDPTFNSNSVYDLGEDWFMDEYRKKYDDFKLIESKKIDLNGTEAYLFKFQFSFYSEKVGKTLSSINILYVALKQTNKKLYALQANAEPVEFKDYEDIFINTFNTFKLE